MFVAEVPGPEDKIAVRLIDGILYIRGTGGFSREVPIEGANDMQMAQFQISACHTSDFLLKIHPHGSLMSKVSHQSHMTHG